MNRQLQFLKKLSVLFSVSLLLCFTSIKAQTLNPGDLAVIGWSALSDEVHLVTLVDIPAGTVIKITDKGWDGSTNAFTSSLTGDGIITWTVSSMMPAGTVLELILGGADDGTALTDLTNSANLTPSIVVSGYTVNDAMLATGDQIFIYQGADTNPFFIFGLNNSGGTVDATNWNTSIAAALRDSQLPNSTGSQNALTNGVNAIGLPGDDAQKDNVQYTGPITEADRDTWLARITDIANWGGSDVDGNPSNPITSTSPPSVAIGTPNALPTVTGLPVGITITEDVMGNLDIASSNFADEDSDEIIITLSVSNGAIAFSATNIPVTLGGNGTAMATITGALSDINSYVDVPSNIQYIPQANRSGSAADILTITANDGDGSGDVSLGTVPINITAVNDAPTITAPTAIMVDEDVPRALTAISFADVDAGSGIVTATLSVPAGSLSATSGGGVTVGGTASAITLAGSIANVNAFIAAGQLTYTPAVNSTADATLAVSINDGGNTGSGGSRSANETIVLQITAVNDPPQITTSGGTVTFTEPEEGSPVPVAMDGGLTVSDVDNGTLASATVAITVNFQADEDKLAFDNDGSTMGNISDSYDAGTGVLTLTSAGATATLAEWQTALRSVTYSNNSQDPNTASRTVRFVVNDEMDDSAPATKAISVVAVNTPPVAVDDEVAVTEDIPATGNTLTNDSDVEGDALTASLVTAPVNGTVVLNADGSFTYTPNANHNGRDSLTYQVCDNGAPSLCDTALAYFNVEAINNAPSITAPATIAVDEDVITPLTGISFADVDAGSGDVTATFSVPSGTLSATSGGGTTVSGSGTASLTLVGTIADLNAFIAASGLNFATALNATSNVTLTVSIDDGGHTGTDPGNSGTGSSEADATTITLIITAVNDVPVNTVPANQEVDQDGALVFSTGNGNIISISDVDAGGGTIRVTLTATNGLITLGSTTGLTFISGSGAGDGTMTFEGSIADINTALNGLTFVPASGYSGAASLQVVTDDLGLTGSGGGQIDTDAIDIAVNAINPGVTSVNAASVDGTYKIADAIMLTVSFDQAVMVDVTGGLPTLLLETGSVDREATYVSGSGSNTLVFNYTVQAGDLSADLDYASTAALALSGAAIKNASGDDAVLTLPAVGGANSIAGQHSIAVDGVAPAVTLVAVPADGYYLEDDVLTFTVQLDEDVIVNTGTGIPYLELTIGVTEVQAFYISGSGTNSLNFSYTVQPGEQDLDGVVLGSNMLLNDGTVEDAAGNNVVTGLNNVAPTHGVFIYAITPGVTLSTAAVSPVSQAFTVSMVFTEPVTGFTMGDITATNATISDLQTADNITYTVLVTPTVDGSASIHVPADVAENIGNNGNTASNTLTLTYDGTAPMVTSVEAPADGTYRSGDVLTFIVHYSEDIPTVSGMLTLPVTIGATTVQASLTDTTRKTVVFSYTVLDGELDTDGIEIGPDLLLNGGALRDEAGNDGSLVLAGVGNTSNILVDAVVPEVTSVSVPADGYYKDGDVLIFMVQWGENVTVDVTGGIPYLELVIGTATVQAANTDGSGTDALTFSYTVQPADLDLDGIAIDGDIILDGGTIRDAAGNDATLTLSNVASTAGIFVYSVRPSVTLSTSVVSPGNTPFTTTVTFSEAVTGFALGDVVATNATLSNLQTADNITYTVLVTPVTDGTVSLEVPADVAMNVGNNGNTVSNTLTVTYDGTAPAAPSDLAADAGEAQVELSWAANAEADVVSYRVYGGIASSPTALLETIASPQTAFIHTGLINGVAYGYQISAVDATGNESPLTAIVNATPMADQAITFNALTAMTYGDDPITLTATASSGLPISYTSSDPAIASVADNVLTIHASGTVTITARQEGDEAFHAADPVSQVLAVSKATLTVAAEAKTKVHGADDPALTYTYDGLVGSDSEAVFTGALVREPGEEVATYAIAQGTLAAGDNYAIAFTAADFIITWSAITGVTLEDSSFVYDGTAHSLAVSGSLPDGTAVTYAGNSRTDVGTQRVTATISGDNYEDLVLTADLTITPATRSIAFAAIPAKTYGDADFDAGAIASTDEEVSYTSSDAAVAEIVDGQVHITGAGTATITATVPQNGNYSNRPEATQVLTVSKATQAITFNAPMEASRDAGSIPLDATASSGLPIVLTVDDPEVATLSGLTLNILRLGTVRITAMQEGDANYEPAEPVTVAVRVIDPASDMPIRIHKAVSPNGDGINEYLVIEAIKDYPENRVTVFNRNGTIVYEASGYNNGTMAFRGIGAGQLRVAAGTYFYVAEIKVDGEWKYEKGWFVLRY